MSCPQIKQPSPWGQILRALGLGILGTWGRGRNSIAWSELGRDISRWGNTWNPGALMIPPEQRHKARHLYFLCLSILGGVELTSGYRKRESWAGLARYSHWARGQEVWWKAKCPWASSSESIGRLPEILPGVWTPQGLWQTQVGTVATDGDLWESPWLVCVCLIFPSHM